METKEDGEERYRGGQGKAGRKKDVCSGRWQWLDPDYSGPCQGWQGPLSGPWRTTSASSPRVPSAFRELRCPATPALPGSRSSGRAAPLWGHRGAHPPRPPVSSPSGPGGATGQRSSGSARAGLGEELSFSALAAPGVPQRPPRLPRHQLLQGCGAVALGLRGAPGRRRGSGAASRRKHPAT